MNESRFYKILSIGLLIFNVILVIALIVGRPKHGKANHKPGGPKKIIIDKLSFDDAQVKKFEALILTHGQQIEEFQEEIIIVRSEIYSRLDSKNLTVMDSLNQVLSSIQSEIEKTHFNHFKGIKDLCNKEQLVDYQNLTSEFSEIFFPKPQKRKAKH